MKVGNKITQLGAIGLLLIAAACTTPEKPRIQEEKPWVTINNWMRSEPRDIAIRVDANLPRHRIEVHESRAWQGAGQGAAGGAYGSLYGGASTGDPIGLALGVVLMPVFALGGAIYGAIDADPAISYHPIDEVAGAEPLLHAGSKDADFRGLLSDRVNTVLYQPNYPDISFVPSNKTSTPQSLLDADVLIAVALRQYDLLGDIDDNPSVRLILRGSIIVGAHELGVGFACPWSYESQRRRLSEWANNGAELFQKEIHLAAQNVAVEITKTLQMGGEQCKPSMSYLQWYASWESCYQPLGEAERLDIGAQQRHAELCSSYGRLVVWRWHCLAAHQGDPDAQYNIGESYRLGREPAEIDSVRAYSWHILASTQGHKAASQALARLSTKLTADQIAEAGSLAPAWTSNTAQCDLNTIEREANLGGTAASVTTKPSRGEAFNAEWISTITSRPVKSSEDYSFDGKWIFEIREESSWSSGDRQVVTVFGNRFKVKVLTNGWRGTITGEIDQLGNLGGTGTLKRMGLPSTLLNFSAKRSEGSFYVSTVGSSHWGSPPFFTISLTRK